MALEIIDKRWGNTVLIGEVSAGEFFMYSDELHIKTNNGNSVTSLVDGVHYEIPLHTYVTRIPNVKITLEN